MHCVERIKSTISVSQVIKDSANEAVTKNGLVIQIGLAAQGVKVDALEYIHICCTPFALYAVHEWCTPLGKRRRRTPFSIEYSKFKLNTKYNTVILPHSPKYSAAGF
jgi:hypothetical protein